MTFGIRREGAAQLSRRAVLATGLTAALSGCAGAQQFETPFSSEARRPRLKVPTGACDSHIHILDPRFPATDGWRGEPVNAATVAAYRRLQARIGTTRAVVVTPSTYGIDNRATLDALEQFGDNARGVIVIDGEAPPRDLRSLAAKGVSGIRVNFVSPQPWGRTELPRLISTARIAADLGWHVQIYARGDQIASMEAAIAALPAEVVIDHLGAVDPRDEASAKGSAAVLRLLARGRAWMKLSGAYISSATGGPNYDDMCAIARRYVDTAPDRLVWGSDWPHRGHARNLPDDAALIDLLLRWAPDAVDRQRILVDNPARLYGFA